MTQTARKARSAGSSLRHMVTCTALSGFAILGGCYGTVYTRWHPAPSPPDATWVGWPLFESVHADLWLLLDGGESCKTVVLQPFAVLMMPFDLAIDLLLLPVDVVAGVAGCSKNRVPSDDAVDGELR